MIGRLVVASRDGSVTHELPVVGPAAFVFDPTGDTLATIAADEPVDPTIGLPIGPLRIIDPATGATRMLLDGQIVAFFWSPDGRTIATIQPTSPGDDNVAINGGVDLAGAVEPRSPAAAGAQAPGVGARLTFVDVSTGKVRLERVVHLADHFVNQLLPYFDQYALSHSLVARQHVTRHPPRQHDRRRPTGGRAGGRLGSPADRKWQHGILEPIAVVRESPREPAIVSFSPGDRAGSVGLIQGHEHPDDERQ